MRKLRILIIISLLTNLSCTNESATSNKSTLNNSTYNVFDTTKNIDSEIDNIMKPLINSGKFTGAVVGVIKGNTQQIYKYGKVNKNSNIVPDEKTIFKIGSITKVFTATLLCDMALKSTVSLRDPVQKFLPNTVKVPTFQDKNIELWQLATHVSGLPKMPEDLIEDIHQGKVDISNPLLNYTLEKTYNYISNYKLFQNTNVSPPKGYGYFDYSNLGMGLLGHALSLKLNTNYENAIKQTICKTLAMNNTTITLSKEQQLKFAKGYLNGEPKENDYFPEGFAGAGAFTSNMEDMMKFLSANLGTTKSSLTPAINQSHLVIFPNLMSLGWHLDKSNNGKQVFWKNGAVPSGYNSYITFVEESQTGVVILTNSFNTQDSSIDNAGKNIINLLNQWIKTTL